MIIMLLIGLILAAAAVTLLARAVAVGRFRVAETIGRIGDYGFEPRLPEVIKEGRGLRGLVDRLAEGAGVFFAARVDSLGQAQIRDQLRAAGFYGVSVRRFFGYRALSAVGMVAFAFWVTDAIGVATIITLLCLPVLALVGWQLPLSVLRTRAQRRVNEIDHELPELIDLLVVTVEAGVGFAGSMRLASERFTGPLGDELRLVHQEQRMGLTTTETLRNLLARCDTPGIRAFVRAIVQGEALGVSIGRILRELAVEIRKQRRQKAEERAQKAPIKMLFPLIFLIFPAIFVVLLAPAVFALLDAL